MGENRRCHNDLGRVKSSICLVCPSSWVVSCIIMVSDRVRDSLKASSALFLASLAASSWISNLFVSAESVFGLVESKNALSALRITSARDTPSESALSVAFWLSCSLIRIVNWENLSAMTDTFRTGTHTFGLYYVLTGKVVT